MYLPSYHAELNLPVLRQFVRENPLGILTTAIKSSSHPLLQSSHIPWILDVEDNDSETELGRLRGHIARQNPQAKAIIESLTHESTSTPNKYLEEKVLVLFNGPVHHYVTPKFYTETKPTSGKVVPTWDYSAVQVYGAARIYFDTRSTEFSDFLSQQLSDLSLHAETSIMGYRGEDGPRPWEVSDAPSTYIDLLKKNIIGIEVQIESMTGKFKMSQEKIKGDRDGVIKGFESLNSAAGAQMAATVRERAALFDAKKGGKRLS
ncbi:putative FMN-binding domain-containing protein [Lipomyces starkeyi]